MDHSKPTFYRPNGYHMEDSVAYLMRNIMLHVAQSVELNMAHTDLTNAQWLPLYKLYKKDASTVAELARACDVDNGGVTRLLDRLEAKGLCQRVRSEQDRRVVNIQLTPTGTAAAAEILPILCEVLNAHLTGFSAEEHEALKGYLRRILDNAKRIKASSCAATPISSSDKDTPHAN